MTKEQPNFKEELTKLLNEQSIENASNTPDFILAQYLLSCLKAFEEATNQREAWYGKFTTPVHPQVLKYFENE